MNQIVPRVSKRKRAVGGLVVATLLASGLIIGPQQGWTETVAQPPGEDVPNSPGATENTPTVVTTFDPEGQTITITFPDGTAIVIRVPADENAKVTYDFKFPVGIVIFGTEGVAGSAPNKYSGEVTSDKFTGTVVYLTTNHSFGGSLNIPVGPHGNFNIFGNYDQDTGKGRIGIG